MNSKIIISMQNLYLLRIFFSLKANINPIGMISNTYRRADAMIYGINIVISIKIDNEIVK